MKLPILAVLACALAACVTASGSSGASQQGLTIFISVDGFRADYLDRGVTPVLSSLAEDGVRSSIAPSFPSVTFPNHYTLITGLYPDHHGIVDNHFEDHDLGKVWDLYDPLGAASPEWWTAAVPLWASAEEQGVRSGVMFWPSVGYDRSGKPPALFEPFDVNTPMIDEPDKVFAWLDLPARERPRFILLYFYFVDHVGHQYGPASPETDEVMRQVDAALGKLLDGLKARRLFEHTNLVVVADHGMTDVSKDRAIRLETLIDPDKVRIITPLSFEPKPGAVAEVEWKLLGRHGHVECWRKGEMPARFHYGTNKRIPPIVCLSDNGWQIVSNGEQLQWLAENHGNHGFDPDEKDMAAVFVAHGPAFRQDITWPKFPNVNVYPLLAKVIGIRPEPNDGNLSEVEGMLAPGR